MRTLRMIGSTFGALVLAGTLAAVASPAHAAVTDDCRTVTVELTDRNDTRPGGVVWAKNKLTRTLEVCRDETGEEPEGKTHYRATVKDVGTFRTEGSKSPNGDVDLPAGVEGTVNGGFRVGLFTAGLWDADFELTAPGQDTSSGSWVSTAFPGSEGAVIGVYRWQYKTACETYTDNNGVYAGDITKVCPTTEPTTEPTTQPTVEPTTGPTTAPTTGPTIPAPGAGGGLPVTGSPAAVLGGVGLAAVLLGAGALVLLRRRRVQFES